MNGKGKPLTGIKPADIAQLTKTWDKKIVAIPYLTFKHKVRTKLPNKIRYATVCRKCKKAQSILAKCFTCKVDQTVDWSKPYWEKAS